MRTVFSVQIAVRLEAEVQARDLAGSRQKGLGRPRRRWWALSALALGALTLGFDVTIMTVALPTIATELRAGTGALQWMVNAYVLALAGLMLVCGVLGDRYGRKRLLLVGLAVFAAAAAVAAWADTAETVIAARAAMGIGGAILLPVGFAAVAALFTSHERGKAISVLVMAGAAGAPLGPLIGGYLLEHYWWGSMFLINIPLALVAMAAIAAAMPETRDPNPARLDLPGGLLSTGGMVALVYGLIEAPERGWGSSPVIAALTIAALLLAAFTWWELRTSQPMIDLRLFRRPQFLWAGLAGGLVSFGLLGMLFVIPHYLQLVTGHDALGAGIRLLPLAGGLIIGAPAGERLAARTAYRVPIALGLVILAAALTAGATTKVDSGYGLVAGWLAVAGLGIGMALSAAMDAVLGVLPPEHAGGGIAITITLRQTGGALGVATLGSVLSQGYTDKLQPVLESARLPGPAAEAARDSLAGALVVAARLSDPPPAAALAVGARTSYLHGMSVVMITTAAMAAVGAALIAALLPGRPAPARGIDGARPDRQATG
ncbi:MFS transporter [Actinomadura fulvescens]|uniref:DHA2 family efflux MFS transporter permease subunit n=1 Tax=Actinomadura fulvescens TaxID=46160 RepID=A0ABN3QWR4_9ACTN